jgi:hypothetical protein
VPVGYFLAGSLRCEFRPRENRGRRPIRRESVQCDDGDRRESARHRASGSWFAECFLSGLNLIDSNVGGSLFPGSRLLGCQFAGADVTSSDFSPSKLEECDFAGERLDSNGFGTLAGRPDARRNGRMATRPTSGEKSAGRPSDDLAGELPECAQECVLRNHRDTAFAGSLRLARHGVRVGRGEDTRLLAD